MTPNVTMCGMKYKKSYWYMFLQLLLFVTALYFIIVTVLSYRDTDPVIQLLLFIMLLILYSCYLCHIVTLILVGLLCLQEIIKIFP